MKMFRCASAALVVLAASSLRAEVLSDPAAELNVFCQATYGLKHEELTSHFSPDGLKLVEDGAWKHVSENSACIAWETSLPARGFVEYGPTASLGSKTDESERPFYIHVHHLKGLEPGKTYHYRTVSIDESGKRVEGETQTLQPKKIEGAIYIPGDLGAPPYELNKGGTYVLTEDIISPVSGIAINAAGVTLDLNGHTITYNNDASAKEQVEQQKYGALAVQGKQGVRVGYASRGQAKLLNGFVRQGAGNGGIGNNPVIFRGSEIAGVVIDYQGPQLTGIDNECKDVHHNVITDHGNEVANRHQGVDAIAVQGNSHHNLIKRVRQRGINAKPGAKINHNEIYVDSQVTNSFGIMFYRCPGGEAIGNKVFGRGYLAIGIGTVGAGVKDITVRDNFIHMQSLAPLNTSAEYGDQSGAYGVRVTWGGENVVYENNVIVSKGRDGGMVRGIWFCPDPSVTRAVFRNNLVKVLSENEKTDIWGAIVVSGADSLDVPAGLFEGNTIISNFCNVRLGEHYGTGNNAQFIDNTFVRVGESEKYRTVHTGFGMSKNKNSVFAGTKFEGGASFDKTKWENDADNQFGVGEVMMVKTKPFATVIATSSDGAPMARAVADQDGQAKLAVPKTLYRASGQSPAPQYTITATLGGQNIEAQVASAGE